MRYHTCYDEQANGVAGFQEPSRCRMMNPIDLYRAIGNIPGVAGFCAALIYGFIIGAICLTGNRRNSVIIFFVHHLCCTLIDC